jgi:ABC-type multidrug transport system fused ATPase/permease subunit
MPRKPTLELPKVSLSALKQIFFVFREVIKITWSVNPWLISADLVLNSIWGLTNLPTLYLGKLVIDSVIQALTAPDKTMALKSVAFFLLLAGLINLVRQNISRLLRLYEANLSRRTSARVEVLIGQKMSELDIPTIEDPDFKNRFDKVERESSQRVWNLITPISDVPAAIFGIFSSLVLVLSFNPLTLLLIIILSLPNILINARFIKAEYEFETNKSPKYRLWGWLSYFLTRTRNYFEPRILGNSPFLVKRVIDLQEDIIGERERLRGKRTKIRAVADLPSWMFLLGLNIWLFSLAILGKITLGTAQMLYNAITDFQRYVENLIGDLLNIYENYLYMLDLVWILYLKPKEIGGTLIPKRPCSQGILFNNVWFRYPKARNWTLKGVNLSIDPKENIAIVGENGAGKTTLIKLLCGFYHPQRGEILFNGTNIADYKKNAYWKILSVLFQSFEEYPFTAKESIGYGDISKINNIDQIISAAKQTDIHSFIDSLPLKYENPLTKEFEKGIEPSKGQWQRIALARTLFKGGEIVVLDEPTSNVDPKAEEEIFDKVIDLTRKKILMLISHRFSTVRRADRVFVMDKGRMVEEGSHEELLKKDGLYAKLFKLQAKGYQ